MLSKLLYIIIIISIIVCAPSVHYKLTKEQDKKIRQAKSLRKNGLIQESISIYLDVLNRYPYLKEAFNPLKKILKEQKNFILMDSIAFSYQKAYNFNLQSKVETFEMLLWTDNKNYIKTINEITETPSATNKQLETVTSALLNNNKINEIQNLVPIVRKNKKPDFFSFQLGLYYSMNMEIEKSINEYLLYLKHNPSKKRLISNRIFSLSDIQAIINKIKSILESSELIDAKIILSDFYFKEKEYSKSYDLINQYSNNENEKIEFVKNLIKLKEYQFAQEIIADIMNNSKDEFILKEAIIQLAKIFEKLIVSEIYDLPITNDIIKNELLNSQFVKVNNKNSEFLTKAIGIYDSLRVNNKNNESIYYLAEIKYKILGDLDGSKLLYQSLINKSSSKYKDNAKERMVDIEIAKGDLNNALDIIKTFNKKELEYKKFQILFYQHKFKELKELSDELLKRSDKNNKYYNDVLKIISTVMLFYDNDEALKKYANAMLKIYQNKRSEAINMMLDISNNQNVQVVDKINFELAYLNLLQGNTSEAINLLGKIESKNSAYIEISTLLKAEIEDYILNDKSKAVELYLFFLDNFPDSIYYDAIRIRLRDLAS